MKAAIVEQAGQKPACGDFPAPVPASDEVTIHVAAAALTPLARARAAGTHYTSGGSFPFVAGWMASAGWTTAAAPFSCFPAPHKVPWRSR